MKIRLNEDAQFVAKIRKGLLARELHCPCKLPLTEKNIYIYKKFREQIADPSFEGYCHCRLYYKEL